MGGHTGEVFVRADCCQTSHVKGPSWQDVEQHLMNVGLCVNLKFYGRPGFLRTFKKLQLQKSQRLGDEDGTLIGCSSEVEYVNVDQEI